MKSALKLVAVNVAVLCTTLVCLEVFAQVGFVMVNGYAAYGASPDLAAVHGLFERHPYLVARPRSNVRITTGEESGFTLTARHTRWTGAPEANPAATPVAVLGGSTSFGTHVDDEDTWPAQLQARLGQTYAVTNYGVPGYSTAEAIIQMALLVPEEHPRVVVFYQGWNDIRNYHEANVGPDYYSHGIRQIESFGLPITETGVLDRLSTLSATVRIVRSWALRLNPPQAVQPVNGGDPFIDRIYARNLSTLKALARHIQATPVFVPQVLNDSAFIARREPFPWSRHIRNDAMPDLIRRFNGIMASVCRTEESDCAYLSEVAEAGWNAEDFVDEGHLSRQGGAKLSALVERAIRRLGSPGHDRRDP